MVSTVRSSSNGSPVTAAISARRRARSERGPGRAVELDEHQVPRGVSGQALEEVAHRMVGAKALGRGGRLVGARVQRARGGEQSRQLGEIVGGQAAERAGIERLEV